MSTTFSFASAFAYAGAGSGCANPSITINNDNNFIEVHSVGTSGNNLHYILGTVDGPSYAIIGSPVAFDSGRFPSVALQNLDPDNFFIVVFTDSSGHLLARYGRVDFTTGNVTWYKNGVASKLSNHGDNITTAYRSSVAINPDGNVVVVYQDSSNDLWYKTCFIDEDHDSLNWTAAVQYSTGAAPKVAMNQGNSVVEVHSSVSFNSLYYSLGAVATVNENSTTLSFLSQDQEYLGESLGSPSGYPCVGINVSGQVIEVHMPGESGDLWFQGGQISGSAITFTPSVRYLNSDVFDDATTGMYPAAALNDNGVGIQVYQSNDGKLYFSKSFIADRTGWMKNFGTKTLSEICLPGSHDAGMSQATLCDTGASYGNTVTQVQNIGAQLNAGIRYFDIRPVFNSASDIYTGHYSSIAGDIAGCYGQYMPDVLSEVNGFITQSAASSEVVVLKFSHFLDKSGILNHFFSTYSWIEGVDSKQPLINGLIEMITQNISSSHLYIHSGNTRITENTINTITNNGTSGKVIILFDIADLDGVALNHNSGSGSVSYVNSYLDLVAEVTKASADWVMYDTYSKTPDLNKMTSATDTDGQLYMINQSPNHTGDVYLCSWTLTLSNEEAENPFAFTILELCQLANGVLANDMMTNIRSNFINSSTFPNILYVDSADCPATDVCIWINQQNIK